MHEIRIEFDGGSTCNVPRLGFGNGYGSYKINDEPVKKMDFNLNMSANQAELETAACAIEDATIRFPGSPILICGDSKITINWINKISNGSPVNQKPSWREEFYGSLMNLKAEIKKASKVRAEWRGREKSVELFGH